MEVVDSDSEHASEGEEEQQMEDDPNFPPPPRTSYEQVFAATVTDADKEAFESKSSSIFKDLTKQGIKEDQNKMISMMQAEDQNRVKSQQTSAKKPQRSPNSVSVLAQIPSHLKDKSKYKEYNIGVDYEGSERGGFVGGLYTVENMAAAMAFLGASAAPSKSPSSSHVSIKNALQIGSRPSRRSRPAKDQSMDTGESGPTIGAPDRAAAVEQKEQRPEMVLSHLNEDSEATVVPRLSASASKQQSISKSNSSDSKQAAAGNGTMFRKKSSQGTNGKKSRNVRKPGS